MVMCKCGKDSTAGPGFIEKNEKCDRCDRSSGYRRCGGCTRGPRDVVLKCCGNCSPAGKIKCHPCNGTGYRKIKEVCTKTHRR